MSDINSVIVCGRLTQKPELKYGQSGTAYARLSLANNTWDGHEDKVNFFNVTVFARRAETCNEYLDKGSQVIIHGKLDFSSWIDKESGKKRTSIGIIAREVQFVGGKKGDSKPKDDYAPPSKDIEPESEPDPSLPPPIDDGEDISF